MILILKSVADRSIVECPNRRKQLANWQFPIILWTILPLVLSSMILAMLILWAINVLKCSLYCVCVWGGGCIKTSGKGQTVEMAHFGHRICLRGGLVPLKTTLSRVWCTQGQEADFGYFDVESKSLESMAAKKTISFALYCVHYWFLDHVLMQQQL